MMTARRHSPLHNNEPELIDYFVSPLGSANDDSRIQRTEGTSLRNDSAVGYPTFFDAIRCHFIHTCQSAIVIQQGSNHGDTATTQERISLYIILDDEFALCSRISSNPRWQECGRSSYPKAQGIIGRAWEERQCFENQMPQYSKNNKKYVNYMKKKYHVPIDVTEALSMKSRLYFGYRLDDHNGQAPVGVFVIESLASEKFTEEELINVLNGDKEYIYEMINAFKDHIPALQRVKHEEGF